MHQLLLSTTSPFARKTLCCLYELGLENQIELTLLKTNQYQEHEKVVQNNALGKIPILILENGEVIYDSIVICEYLNQMPNQSGIDLFLRNTAHYWQAQKLHSLADGLTETGIVIQRENSRPELYQMDDWKKVNQNKINRTLDELENGLEDFLQLDKVAGINIGSLSLAGSLNWLEFRDIVSDFYSHRPKLKFWLDEFSNRSSLQKTMPKD